MKRDIPQNAVTKDYRGQLNSFIDQLLETEKDNVISIFLQGSFARGEATDNSDLDIWCIFKIINIEILDKVKKIIDNLPISYTQFELNAQCVTYDEFHSNHFSNFFSKSILYFEAVLLWGESVIAKTVQDEEIEKTYKKILSEVLLGIRHYITVNEPSEKLSHQKIKTWVLKPTMFALRLERYLCIKKYPITINDLLNSYDIPPKLIQYFIDKDKWEDDIHKNRDKTLHCLHDEVESLLKYNTKVK